MVWFGFMFQLFIDGIVIGELLTEILLNLHICSNGFCGRLEFFT